MTHRRALKRKRILETEPRPPGFERAIDFGHEKNEIGKITIDEIPAIGVKLVLHLVDEIRRPVKIEFLFPPRQYPQQPIESDEMINMGVGDKDVLQAIYLSRRQI